MAAKKSSSSDLRRIEKRLERLEDAIENCSDVKSRRGGEDGEVTRFCGLPIVPERKFDTSVSSDRAALIRVTQQKWVNGTVLHYYFFDKATDGRTVFFTDGTSEFRTWTTTEAEEEVVRDAFKVWKDVGVGLEFKEVDSRDDAEIRIAFERGDGAWSYLGRDILTPRNDPRTMNFGWDLTDPGEIDTAVHEIGHTLGFPHEHQNPNAGIEWDEEAVYAALAAPPNEWTRAKTLHNILRKIDPDTVQGSNWDPNSIMHYPFGPGLIISPEEHADGINPAPGLSERDKAQVRFFYPPLHQVLPEIKPFEPKTFTIGPGEQLDFAIIPASTRYYNIRTFGTSDTVMVLFEDENGTYRYLEADDDSGTAFNANIHRRLLKGHRYVVRTRLYYSSAEGDTALMMW